MNTCVQGSVSDQESASEQGRHHEHAHLKSLKEEADASSLSDARIEQLMRPLMTGSGCLLALSGGPDSSCLLHMVALMKHAHPQLNIHVATVDHFLRAESSQEAVSVGIWAARLGLKHAILPWSGKHSRFALQEKAREARYALLREYASSIGVNVLVTAHTQDDQAETIFMRLLSGSGLKGLSGMRERSQQRGMTYLRPLLEVSKKKLLATCEDRGFPYFLDPSNSDERYLRVRLRRLLPVLAQEGLSNKRLAALGERAARADSALEEITEDAWKNVEKLSLGYRFDRKFLRIYPKEIMIRLMDRLIERVRSDHACKEIPGKLEKIEALVDALLTALHKKETMVRTLSQVRVEINRSDVLLALTRSHVRGRADRTSAGFEKSPSLTGLGFSLMDGTHEF